MYVLWNKEKSKNEIQPLFWGVDNGRWEVLEFARIYTEEEVSKMIETMPFEGRFIKLPIIEIK